jgi:hypothetical protein
VDERSPEEGRATPDLHPAGHGSRSSRRSRRRRARTTR